MNGPIRRMASLLFLGFGVRLGGERFHRAGQLLGCFHLEGQL